MSFKKKVEEAYVILGYDEDEEEDYMAEIESEVVVKNAELDKKDIHLIWDGSSWHYF